MIIIYWDQSRGLQYLAEVCPAGDRAFSDAASNSQVVIMMIIMKDERSRASDGVTSTWGEAARKADCVKGQVAKVRREA